MVVHLQNTDISLVLLDMGIEMIRNKACNLYIQTYFMGLIKALHKDRTSLYNWIWNEI